jgi:hypothetical protein
MVSLKLSQDGSFGPLQVEEAVGVSSGPVQVTSGLACDTAPLGGVAAEPGPGRSAMAKARQTANSPSSLEWRAFIFPPLQLSRSFRKLMLDPLGRIAARKRRSRSCLVKKVTHSLVESLLDHSARVTIAGPVDSFLSSEKCAGDAYGLC